jgi:hypothetical protein
MDLTGLTPENLQKFVFDFYGRVSPIDPLATAVLNTHFLVEEEIDAVFAKIPNLKSKRNAVFAQKVKGIRKIAPLGNDKLWQTILAINSLRNKVAHRFDGPERNKALQNLREEFHQSITLYVPNFIDPKWPDLAVVIGAAVLSTIFLRNLPNEIGKQVVNPRPS